MTCNEYTLDLLRDIKGLLVELNKINRDAAERNSMHFKHWVIEQEFGKKVNELKVEFQKKFEEYV